MLIRRMIDPVTWSTVILGIALGRVVVQGINAVRGQGPAEGKTTPSKGLKSSSDDDIIVD